MTAGRPGAVLGLAVALAGCSAVTERMPEWALEPFKPDRVVVRPPASQPPPLPVPPAPEVVQILKLAAPSARGRVKLTVTRRYVRDATRPPLGPDGDAAFDTVTTVTSSGRTSLTDDLGTWTFAYVPVPLRDPDLRLDQLQALAIRFRSALGDPLEIDWDESVLIDPTDRVRRLLRKGDLALDGAVTTSMTEIDAGGTIEDWVLPAEDIVVSPRARGPRAFFELLRPGAQAKLVLTLGRGAERIVKTFVFESLPLRVEMPGPRPVSRWVGEKFVALSRPGRGLYEALQLRDRPTLHPTHDELAGAVLRVTAVTYDRLEPVVTLVREGDGQEYTARPTAGSVDGLAPLADLLGARAYLLGRTLWLVQPYLETRREDGTAGRLATKRFAPVEVFDVSPGTSSAAPIRLFVRTAEGRVGFRDVHVSGTNVPEPSREQGAFEKTFLVEDPRVELDWPDEVWAVIENGGVAVGMTVEQARLSWGAPQRLERVSGPRQEERWVYPNHPTLLFVDGVVARIGD